MGTDTATATMMIKCWRFERKSGISFSPFRVSLQSISSHILHRREEVWLATIMVLIWNIH